VHGSWRRRQLRLLAEAGSRIDGPKLVYAVQRRAGCPARIGRRGLIGVVEERVRPLAVITIVGNVVRRSPVGVAQLLDRGELLLRVGDNIVDNSLC
jgi:hypothetical protein